MAKELIALLIEFNVITGKRAGDLNPKDPKLQCYGWQKLDGKNSLEIRLIEDDREISQYENISGVTILRGKEAINQAIETNVPIKYGVVDQIVLKEAIVQKGINLDLLTNKTANEIHKYLFDQGVAGIVKKEPNKL